MNKVTWSIPAQVWQGLNTRYSPDSNLFGADEFSDGSINFVTDENGAAVKRPGTTKYNPIELEAPPKDQFEMVFNSGVRHLLTVTNGTLYYSTGDGVFTEAASGFVPGANFEFTAYQDRVYFSNGINEPQVYDLTTSYGGVDYTATTPEVRTMGVAAPSTGPTAGAATAGGNVPDGAHTYKVTFLYYGFQESNGSASSGVITAGSGNNTIPLTAIPVGGYGVTARKIYRDDNDGVYVLVGTLSNNTGTTFDDTATLGTTPIPLDNNVPPTWSLAVTHRDRIWMAGVSSAQSTLYYTEAGLPDVTFTNNFIACSQRDPITALAIYNDRVVVFNKASFGIIQGTTSRDFRYSEISPNIGCADTRSIQVITVRGVPKLQWLSQLGMYQWDGSNLQIVSNKINNLFKFNIQQALATRNKITQSTQADFQAGTSSPGIDLDSNPGTITVKGYAATNNPTKLYDTQGEWEGGTLTNVTTLDGTNTMKVPIRHSPTYSQGTNNGTIIDGGVLKLSVAPDFTGENFKTGSTFSQILPHSGSGGSALDPGFAIISGAYQRIVIPRGSTLNQVVTPHCQFIWANNAAAVYSFELRADNTNVPGNIIHSEQQTIDGAGHVTFFNSGGVQWLITSPNTSQARTITLSQPLAAGVYWLGIGGVQPGYPNNKQGIFAMIERSTLGTDGDVRVTAGSPSFLTSTNTNRIGFTYTVTQTAVAKTGSWIGPTYDSYSTSAISASVRHTGTYPSGTSAITTVEAASNNLFTDNLLTVSANNLSGVQSISLSNRRYWRIKVQLSTNDDRVAPTTEAPQLRFATSATWVSDVIDHTTDIDSLDAIVMASTGSASIEIATSDDNVTYSSYTPLGSATPKRYSKLRVTMGTDVDNVTSDVISSVRLDWTVSSEFISSKISTATIPAGWGFFQATSASNGGSLVFSVRTASSSGGLDTASWNVVTNGQIIPSDVLPWIQWKVEMVATPGMVPTVNDITLNWLISELQGARVASMFYDKCYYLAAATFDSPTVEGDAPEFAGVLGRAENFAVMGSSTVTNTGTSVVTGDLGLSPGTSVTGFPPGVVNGTQHITNTAAANAQTDAMAAYTALAALPFTSDLTSMDLGSMVLGPGVYKFDSSAGLTGTLTLDAQGDPNAEWIFQIGSTLTTASSSIVSLINGALSGNVYWQVGSSATLGTSSTFAGTIIALASVTSTTSVAVDGRLFALTGAVTLDTIDLTVSASVESGGPSKPNNIVLRFDENGNWARFDGLSINTMGLFFGDPYFGSALNGFFYKWLDESVLLDDGENIEFDLRTAAFEPEDETKAKMVKDLVVQTVGTGARITPSYSVSQGKVWLPMVDVVTGLPYYDTPDNGEDDTIRFTPTSDTIKWGYSLMFRLHSYDEHAVEISGMRANATLSDRPVLLRQ